MANWQRDGFLSEEETEDPITASSMEETHFGLSMTSWLAWILGNDGVLRRAESSAEKSTTISLWERESVPLPCCSARCGSYLAAPISTGRDTGVFPVPGPIPDLDSAYLPGGNDERKAPPSVQASFPASSLPQQMGNVLSTGNLPNSP